jgi:hypothetical protein
MQILSNGGAILKKDTALAYDFILIMHNIKIKIIMIEQ